MMRKGLLIIFLCSFLVIAHAEPARDPFVAHPAHAAQIAYENGLISLNFVQINIHAALQQFAQLVNLNMSLNEAVAGEISLHLNEVPWEDALLAMLQSAGLDHRYINDIIYIAPSEFIAQNEEVLLQAKQQQQALQTLTTDYVRIHYAKADVLANLIKSKENSLLSERGQVSIDARTNTLILQDVPSQLTAIYQLIAELDIPVQQVMIEARIINAKHSFTRDLGINFGISAGGEWGSGVSLDFDSASLSQLLTHDLPQDNQGPLGLAVATLADNILIDLEISAAESENNTKVIASPRLITANQSEAVIRQGKQIAFEESTPTGATSVSFRDAVLELSVVPHITPDSHIILQLDVKQDVLGHFAENGQPTIDTKSITTQVLVADKSTIVLGGIYSRTESDSISRVPFLNHVPWLGRLFQDKNHLIDRDELLIFVTPTIIREAVASSVTLDVKDNTPYNNEARNTNDTFI